MCFNSFQYSRRIIYHLTILYLLVEFSLIGTFTDEIFVLYTMNLYNAILSCARSMMEN